MICLVLRSSAFALHFGKNWLDAGFETGHAYGKALHCKVLCRQYPVPAMQDRHMALYMQWPATRGCTSSYNQNSMSLVVPENVQEAQSKDFGGDSHRERDGTYLNGGNGGMKPRHADLFATDLDDQTSSDYDDSILMFMALSLIVYSEHPVGWKKS